jgi:SAM-dependent methyltransferase
VRSGSDYAASMPEDSVMATDWRRLRTTFEEVPELYDRARPAYPPQIFDDLVALAELPAGARLVEIGCGTGRATLQFAPRGYEITCVELGEQLAGIARRNLAGFPRVQVINADFETWQPAARFDAAVAFTSFHWLDPATRFEKVAAVLEDRGILAVVGGKHVLLEDGDQFFVEVQAEYVELLNNKDGPPPHPDAWPDLWEEIERSGLFDNVAVRRYLRDIVYTADSYIDMLDTSSGHRALDSTMRDELFRRIRRRIDVRPGGTVTKTLLSTLNVARRTN